MSARINKMSAATAQSVFWIYAALNGLSLSSLFMVYTGVSIAKVFFITAGMFATMSLYGYTTKNDGHGFGLHTSALQARELGGELKAYSDGEESGARFELSIAVDPVTTGGG